ARTPGEAPIVHLQSVTQASKEPPTAMEPQDNSKNVSITPYQPLEEEVSNAKDDWDHQKEFEGAKNEQLDSLMKMIGLEEVKQKFLNIKAKVDTALRQGTDMKNERFGAALLGN